MERKLQVQIPKDLLLALFQYHLAGNEEYLPEIEKALMEKLDSMVKRQLYTTFKTAPTADYRLIFITYHHIPYDWQANKNGGTNLPPLPLI